jgi:hypothetical protein
MKTLLLVCLLASTAFGQGFTSGYDRIRWSGVDITRRTRLNFTGTGITSVVDDPANGQTTVTISGGGGGGGADSGSAPTLLCLAGRTGTTNNPLLSTDGDGTLTGSGVASGGLILQSSPDVAGASTGLFAVKITTPTELDPPHGFTLVQQFQDLTLAHGLLIGFGFGEDGITNPTYTLKSGVSGITGILGMNFGFELRNAPGETQGLATFNVVEDD